MLINVPQYIDVEDKIVGPLTAKQLGWIIGLSVILLIMWNMLPKPVFFIIGIPLTILFIAFAFYKPYGQPLGSFIIFGIMYFFRPRIYVWKRTPENFVVAPVKKENKNEVYHPEKHISTESLRDLARLLDSEGSSSNAELESILKDVPKKK